MIRVRKATLNDAEVVATYLFLAMEDIVYTFIGEVNRQKAEAFMMHFAKRDSNQYSYQNCWVAEDDVKVVAAINVYDGTRLTELRQPIIDHIKKKFNQEFNPEDETG